MQVSKTFTDVRVEILEQQDVGLGDGAFKVVAEQRWCWSSQAMSVWSFGDSDERGGAESRTGVATRIINNFNRDQNQTLKVIHATLETQQRSKYELVNVLRIYTGH